MVHDNPRTPSDGSMTLIDLGVHNPQYSHSALMEDQDFSAPQDQWLGICLKFILIKGPNLIHVPNQRSQILCGGLGFPPPGLTVHYKT
jgi:hypothetical protein